MATYKMTIAGLERELPICKVNDNLDIAGFVIFGDVEMTVAAAAELIKKCPEFDAIVAPEAISAEKLADNFYESSSLLAREAFRHGFKLGANLMLEIRTDKDIE